ncbi:MAG: hypothetical protein K2L98_00825, partial [Bacilli bacterium]|nr:hypothetical protein [Bacilli bacterium]
VIILPTVFRYMTIFQKHVITNNTIGNLVLGGSGGENGDFGDQVALIVFTSFYHPQGTSYSDYFDNDGKFLSGSALQTCQSGGTDSEICEVWVTALQEWVDDKAWTAVGPISRKSKLYNSTNDDGGMSYMWIITTVCGVVCAWFFFSYAIDVGTRAVKLGFLQLIAPIPVLIKIFPQGKKTFDAWFAEIKKSYLEIFLRLAVIFFIVKLCTMVPSFIDAVWNSGSGITGGFLTKALATVCLILGLLKFAKDAPQLFKTIFASGGGLFAGLDWKPGMKRRISENEYAMKGMSTIAGGASGMLGAARMAYRDSYTKAAPEGDAGLGKARLFGWGAANRAMLRGLVTGAKSGYKSTPSEFSGKGLLNSMQEGVSGAQAAEVKAANKRQQYGGMLHPVKNATTHINEFGENFTEGWQNLGKTLNGVNMNNAAVETIKNANGTIDSYLSLAESAVKPYEDAFNDLQKKLIKGEKVEYNGVEYTLKGDGQALNKYTAAGGRKNSEGHYYNIDKGKFDPNYDPEKDSKYSNSLSALKQTFDQTKNEKIANKVRSDFKDGAATYMANLNKQLSKEIGNLGTAQVGALNDIVKNAGLTHNGNSIGSVGQFLAKLSDTNPANLANITESDIATLKEIKSSMSNLSKNIVISQQAQAAGKKQEKKEGK